MEPKRHPDDVPRTLAELSVYLREAYRIPVSAWTLGELVRRGILRASKVHGRLRSTATAYLAAMDPPARANDGVGE